MYLQVFLDRLAATQKRKLILFQPIGSSEHWLKSFAKSFKGFAQTATTRIGAPTGLKAETKSRKLSLIAPLSESAGPIDHLFERRDGLNAGECESSIGHEGRDGVHA